MSTLIKGMKMPETCNECYLREKNVCPILKCIVEGYYRPSICPLVEVPTPHGRLIDAGEMRFEIERYFDGLPIQGHYDMLKMVDNAPTIIEAEEGEPHEQN